jgi:hypothetical protein
MSKAKTADGTALTYPATTAYKQWVWKEIRRRGKTLQWVVDEMKKKAKPELMALIGSRGEPMYETISTSTMTNLLGAEGSTPPPTNCAWLHALNKALGLAPPPVCDPGSPLSQVKDRLDANWARMTNDERERFLKAIEGVLGISER